MLAFAYFLENAAAGALPLKPFERTFQGLIFADTYLGHCYPSPRSRQWFSALPEGTRENHMSLYSQSITASMSFSEKERDRAIRTNQSGHPFAELCASEYMKVQMGDGLAGIRSAVGNDTVSVSKAFLFGNDADGAKTFGQIPVRCAADTVERGEVFPGDDQHMNRGLGINIPEGINKIVFIHFCGRDFPVHDFTEEAVFHDKTLPFILIL